jgi:4-diphosphocytidyl-2-C-methyl-D-erythritol kinase
MHLREIGRDVVIHTPAKLNLFFEVLETLVYPIDLCDTLVIRKRPDDRVEFRVSCAGQGASGDGASLGDVPADSSNLVVRAIDLLRRTGGYGQGADVLLIKRIPSEAGLGGGSSDAAAALAGVNSVWNLNLRSEQLAEIGAALGSDIPLFFCAGASVCRGRGEIVEAAPTSPVLHFALVRPPVGLSTADVYEACLVAQEPRSLPGFVDALSSADLGRIGQCLFNRLESAANDLTPWIARARRAFGDLDCVGHQMTGSGTCYFGLCRHARHARRVARRLESYGLGKAYAVRGCR